MKRVLRRQVWETNSSTTHDIIILSEKDADRWNFNPALYVCVNYWEYSWRNAKEKPRKGVLYTQEEVLSLIKNSGSSYSEYNEDNWDSIDDFIEDHGFISSERWDERELEESEEHFVTPSGDKMVVMCAYGTEY